MNRKQIEYILEIVKTNNFNRAAENLFISQPTLTYQVKLLEEEIGFTIFDRGAKGAVLTLAGQQFVTTLKDVNDQISKAIEQGQNFSSSYTENIRIAMPTRTSLYLLPQVMKIMKKESPDVLITPSFDLRHCIDSFLNMQQEFLITYENQIKSSKEIQTKKLYTSHLYFVTTWDDPLSQKDIITPTDLQGRTLMIGGTSQPPLRAVQQRMIQTVNNLSYFNSPDHDTSLTNVAAGNANVISPGYLNDHSKQFAWIPFDCEESIHVILCKHSSLTSWQASHFEDLLIEAYQNTTLSL